MKFEDEISVWEYLKNTNKPIILYGMGNGADKVIKVFEMYGIKYSGVMASDGFVRGQKFKGYTVRTLSYFEKIYNDFIIAITFGTQINEVIENIKNIEKKHTVIVPNVPVFGETVFNDKFLSENKEKIKAAYNLLYDKRSREVFEYSLKFYYTGKLKYLWKITDDKDEVFNNILKLTPNENYIDLGAYRGDTIDGLIKYSGGYNKIIAVEPDTKTFKKLNEHIENMENVISYQKTIWKKDTTLLFSKNGGRNSTIRELSKNSIPIEAICIDTLAKDFVPTYIKADVEGAEKQALAGGINTISKYKPKLNFAVYHTFEDLFDLILIINSINSEYKFYLRHHKYIPLWDTNLYCI